MPDFMLIGDKYFEYFRFKYLFNCLFVSDIAEEFIMKEKS